MSEDSDYLYALEMQKRLNALEGEGDSDIEEIDFKKPPAKNFSIKNKKPLQIKRSNPHSNLDEEFLNRTQNLVHPQWETLDPTPDIFSLFGQFDTKFFQGRLKCVTLEWSKRMYSCAGICYSRRNRYGMDITIRLSEPLLKLRTRKDLVETMLHEMIHAYCFVLNIREGNGGHGPNFKKIMHSINTVAGTNITVYHTFHDEVQLYKQHWWRCNGICQDRSPFFGYVKRSSNRAPGPNDQWWASHQEACGGTFMKIKEPEKKKKGKASTKEKENNTTKVGKSASAASTGSTDLRKFFTPQTTSTAGSASSSSSNVKGFGNLGGGFKGPVKTNGGGTMLLNPKTKSSNTTTSNDKTPTNTSSIAKAFPPSSYPGLSSDPFNVDLNTSGAGRSNAGNTPRPKPVGNLKNVVGFKDIGGLGGCSSSSPSSSGGGGNPGRAVSGFKTPSSASSSDWGRGMSLQSSSGAHNISISSSPEGEVVDRKHLRDVWAKRFGGGNSDGGGFRWKSNSNDKRISNDVTAGDSKRRRISSDAPSSNGNDDIFVADESSGQKKNKWEVVDDDLMMQDQPQTVITLSSDDDDDSDTEGLKPKINKNMTMDQRQTLIKQEIVDESVDLLDDEIELIDDEYDDSLIAAAELADTSIIDEFFGEDTLLKEFKRENDCKPSSSRHQMDPDSDIITCPICQGKMTRAVFAEHLNGCTGITRKILPPKTALKKLAAVSKEARPKRRSKPSSSTTRDILRNAGYSDADLDQIHSSMDEDDDEEEEFLRRSGVSRRSSTNNTTTVSSPQDLNSSSEDENSRRFRLRNVYKTTRQCPVCAKEIEETYMNTHLDVCLL
ncbi:DNA-dependent metalloprotease SPRTN [Musca autumnalis]|uniref:DNA-dependent metalloprotease SPRTN n=1 Tax=Musca autumnalis TaxID=221902 RepID=UPI003CEAF5A0